MFVVRAGPSAMLGISMTFALFYMMHLLIAVAYTPGHPEQDLRLVDFVYVKDEPEVLTRRRHVKSPPPPQDQPPLPPRQRLAVNVDATGYDFDNPAPDDGLDDAISIRDSEYLPVVQVLPRYPVRALERGFEGWVVLEFTVTSTGSVVDPVVVQNCAWIRPTHIEGECAEQPDRIFDKEAKRAVQKFKYKPRIVDGMAVATPDVPYRVAFHMTE